MRVQSLQNHGRPLVLLHDAETKESSLQRFLPDASINNL
ncbi:hypothetical protein SynBMKMC1_00936 [Synechococcus sp. BMK-MC-1]|nr:hypothetical protein SynBMKMC1_00936 [Synechococcus sp. BMK-MC-1]